jgi:hypothetical protein
VCYSLTSNWVSLFTTFRRRVTQQTRFYPRELIKINHC